MSTLVWDVKRAREICNDLELDPTTEEIIDEVTHLLPQVPEKTEAHYCRVTLMNVNNDILLDQNKVIEYISQIVPVDYSLEFKDNLLKPSLELPINSAFKERFNTLWIYKISVNNIPVEKSYSSEIATFKFGSLKCFLLKDSKTQEEFAWGWYAMNEEAKQMNDISVSFMRARHCNYQIGPSTLLAGLYPNPVSQAYFIGEIHLTHPQIEPTASRDGIKQNNTKLLFETIAKKFFKELYTLYNKTSKFRSEVVDKVAEASIKISSLNLQMKKEDDPVEKNKIRERIKQAKEDKKKAESKMKTYEDFFNLTDSWNAAEDVLNSVNNSTIKSYNQKEEVQKKDLQIDILKVDDFKTSEEKVAEDSGDEKKIGEKSLVKDDNSAQSGGGVQYSNEEAVVSELEDYKSLGSAERKLIKKFYSVINSVDLPQNMKDRIKKNLKKKILK